jgi:lipopolysaccharide/colanic/teichoic acid biosynthesis glycosyltransferase
MQSKRVFDLLIIIILSPFIILLLIPTYLLCKIINKDNIFFYQFRGGKNGKKIKIIKFRTMDRQGNISRFNRFLRKTKLDEIPQFLSVLNGDLSVVGPRPLHYEYRKYYNNFERKRFKVSPGITGLSQICDDKITWKKQFKIEVWYAENNNILLDIKIILKTVVFLFVSIFRKDKKDKKKFKR